MLNDNGFPIEIKQGVSYLQPFYYLAENGEPLDLTGCSAAMQARKTITAEGAPILDWSTDNGKITIDGPAGCVLVYASAADTLELNPIVEGVYDLILTFPSGYVISLVDGPIGIVGSIVRDAVIDGGDASTVFGPENNIEGGVAETVFGPNQNINN